MKATDFKNKVKEIKEVLKDKKLILEVMINGRAEKFEFSTLKAFGVKVLELEKKGFDFSFSKVSHDLADFNIVETVRGGKARRVRSSFDRTLDYCIEKVPFKQMTIRCFTN